MDDNGKYMNRMNKIIKINKTGAMFVIIPFHAARLMSFLQITDKRRWQIWGSFFMLWGFRKTLGQL